MLENQLEPGRFLTVAVAGSIFLAGSPAPTQPPVTWDGLVQVDAERFDYAYVQPGADFRSYTKVILEPAEVSFRKNWRRDYNASSRSLSSRISDRDEQLAITKAVAAADEIFRSAWTKGGYAMVDEPSPDAMLVRTGILNVTVNAPDRSMGGPSYNLAPEAGSATLFVELRDSMTGALLGRVVDQGIAALRPGAREDFVGGLDRLGNSELLVSIADA